MHLNPSGTSPLQKLAELRATIEETPILMMEKKTVLIAVDVFTQPRTFNSHSVEDETEPLTKALL